MFLPVAQPPHRLCQLNAATNQVSSKHIMNCFQHITGSCGALHSPCGGAPQQRAPIPPLSTLTSRATHTHPTSPAVPRAPAPFHTKSRGGSQRPETYLRITRTLPPLVKVKAATDLQNPRFCCRADLKPALAGNSDNASAGSLRCCLAVCRRTMLHARKVARDEERRQLFIV